MPDLVEKLEAVLPQTQCGQCGYAGCTPYAQALVAGEAEIDRCPPGGDVAAAALARLLGVPARPFDRARGEHLPAQVALIRESECIGCTKCIQACPIDAIVGAAERMHTVLPDACSGCALCLPVCPVDCIDLVALAARVHPVPVHPIAAAMARRDPHADRWRLRHDARSRRLELRGQVRKARLDAQSAVALKSGSGLPPAVLAALARAARPATNTTANVAARPRPCKPSEPDPLD